MTEKSAKQDSIPLDFPYTPPSPPYSIKRSIDTAVSVYLLFDELCKDDPDRYRIMSMVLKCFHEHLKRDALYLASIGKLDFSDMYREDAEESS